MPYDWEPGYRARYLAQNGLHSCLNSYNVHSKSHFNFHEFQFLIVGIFISAGICSLLNYNLTCVFLFYLGILHASFRIVRDKIWHYNVLLISIFMSIATGASLSVDYLLILSSTIYLLALTILGMIGMSPFNAITNSPFVIYLITYSNIISTIIGMLFFTSYYFILEKIYYIIYGNTFTIAGLLFHKIAVTQFKSPFIENKNENESTPAVPTANNKKYPPEKVFKFVLYIIIRAVIMLMVISGLGINLLILSDVSEEFGITHYVITKENTLTYYLLITNLILICFATLAVMVEFLNFFLNLAILSENFVNSYRIMGAVLNSSYRLVLERYKEARKDDDFITESVDDVIDKYKLVKVIHKRRVRNEALYGKECDESIQYYNLTYWCHLFDKWANDLDYRVMDQSKHLDNIKNLLSNQIVHMETRQIVHVEPQEFIPELPIEAKSYQPSRSKSLQQDVDKTKNIPRFQSIPHPLQLPLLECIIPKLDVYVPKGIIERSREEWEKEKGKNEDLYKFDYVIPLTRASVDISSIAKSNIIPENEYLEKTDTEQSICASQVWDSFMNRIDNVPETASVSDSKTGTGSETESRTESETESETETGTETETMDGDFGRISLPETYSNLSQYHYDDDMIISDMSNRLALHPENDILPPINYEPLNMTKGEPLYVSREEYLKTDVPVKINMVTTELIASHSPRFYNNPKLHHNDDSFNIYNPMPPRKHKNTTHSPNRPPMRINSRAQASDGGGTGELAFTGESGAVPEGHEFEPIETNSQDTVEGTGTGPIESSIPDDLSLYSSKFSKISCNADFSDLDDTPMDDHSQSSHTNQSYSPNYYFNNNLMARTARFGKDSDSVTRASSIEQVFL